MGKETGKFEPSGARAIRILLRHHDDMLDMQDLGALSICSKSMVELTKPQWKKRWQECVREGKGHSSAEKDHLPGPFLPVSGSAVDVISDCFFDEAVAMKCRGGFKHALGCLTSAHCFKCGKVAGTANPATLTRLCSSCGSEGKLIPKWRAKESFLLGNQDLRDLSSARILTDTTNSGSVTLYSLDDVVDAALTKHGGASGLEIEFDRRKMIAREQYAPNAPKGRSKKQAPKILRITSRPLEALDKIAR